MNIDWEDELQLIIKDTDTKNIKEVFNSVNKSYEELNNESNNR